MRLGREGIDAARCLRVALKRRSAALRVLAIAWTLLVLGFPMIADLLEGVLE
jgi:hypothetical protein